MCSGLDFYQVLYIRTSVAVLPTAQTQKFNIEERNFILWIALFANTFVDLYNLVVWMDVRECTRLNKRMTNVGRTYPQTI
jgi:hypothetical protein